MRKLRFISSEDACLRLKVSAQTLYAYVSRGLVRTTLDPFDSRKRQYAVVDIEDLVARQERGRSRRSVAQSTIHFGEPILQSRISNIDGGAFYYRGQDAVQLSRTASLEDIFELLCNTTISDFKLSSKSATISKRRSVLARFTEVLADQLARDRTYGNKNQAFRLLKLMAYNAAQQTGHAGQAIHELLAAAWSNDPRAADLIRRGLVLSADHELNASTYATRITASAGANLSACLLTGVATLSGHHHGGLTNLCIAWMKKSSKQKANTMRLSEASQPPGFGHKLYPNGDPRTNELLQHCPPPQSWQRVAKRVITTTNHHPTLDYGLATLEHQLKLPKGAGFSIFAVGRTVGWLAHCFEQRRDGRLIRPRASSESA